MGPDLPTDSDKYAHHPEVTGEGRVRFTEVPYAPTAAAAVTNEDMYCETE